MLSLSPDPYSYSPLSAQSQGHFNDVQQMHYSYDAMGNVLARIDSSIGGKTIEDRFGYDAMNRLTSVRTTSAIKGNYAKSKTYRYDKLGNITYQSGIGNYSYYVTKPHALKAAGNRHYLYDEVGNMTHRNGDIITYNPLNKPAILKNHKNHKEVRFYYGVGSVRYMKRTADRDTYYIDKAYEEQVEDNTEKQICYITIGGKTIGTHVEIKDTDYVPTNPHYNEATYNRYFHTDALGSITAITDDNGTVVERRSYDAFGKIRAMDYGTNNNTLSDQIHQTTRAFTGHEQIAELPGLIHMNARLYDSEIGRFLSADTIIQDPHDSQSYNRYSYVRNNPLVYTDPSGHSWFSRLWRHIRQVVVAVVVAIVAVYTAGAVLGALGYGSAAAATQAGLSIAAGASVSGTAALIASGAAAGFAAGVAGGLLSGASLGQSLRMGLKGAVFGAIGAGVANVIGSAWGGSTTLGAKAGRAILHGLSRAAIAKAQGGRWSAGFWSGFASSALSPLTSSASTFEGKVAMSAIVGGTASELGGGKFANGAVTAAFVMMYNHMAHNVSGHQLHQVQENAFTHFLDGIKSVGVGLYHFGSYLADITGFTDARYGSVMGDFYREDAISRTSYLYNTAKYIATNDTARSLFVDYAQDYLEYNTAHVLGRFMTGAALSTFSGAPFVIPAGSAYGDIQYNAVRIQNFTRGLLIGN